MTTITNKGRYAFTLYIVYMCNGMAVVTNAEGIETNPTVQAIINEVVAKNISSSMSW